MMKTNLEMLVKILENGGSVEYDGLEWAMSDDGSFGTLSDDGSTITDAGMTFTSVRNLANDIDRSELWLHCCGIELSKMNRKERDSDLS